ncbi:B12-binding domain-containing radical SAM protein [Curvivirga sp.]|uniref:B12-binding domain-containing radical SAM protein n=1 Tax=Curvivirga sp. TaxID=2856848 RepID=UPI003B59E556
MNNLNNLECSLNGEVFNLQGQRKQLSLFNLFSDSSDMKSDKSALMEKLSAYLLSLPNLAVYVRSDFWKRLVKVNDALRTHTKLILIDDLSDADGDKAFEYISLDVATLDEVDNFFIAEIDYVHIFDMEFMLKDRINSKQEIITPNIIGKIATDEIPLSAWTAFQRTIYPIRVPHIEIEDNLDVLLFDCPSRNLALMPNGLAYVHNALKKANVKHQTFDLDIVVYHQYHINRIFNLGGKVVLESGYELPEDPWQSQNYDVWARPDVIDYFEPFIQQAAYQIARHKPKILALSIQACNEQFTARLINRVKALFPEIKILLGGYSCNSADIGFRAFPDADYMCIGEADLSVGPLVEAVTKGERPANMPGVLSRDDDPEIPFIPAPMCHNIDVLDFPKYEWFGIDIYINFNGYRLTPVIASRGCRWARCTFCAERFYWRIRSPKNFVDELEWLAKQGCHLFMFNESDLNGNPTMLMDICDEIIRRELNVLLTGQLRIHKRCDDNFFKKLKQAGFATLRFGIDAFSENALRLQKKGYTKDTISKTLKACHDAGILSEINWVIGVPGETEEDIDEGIDLILENKQYIFRLANINPLILANGGVYWLEPEAHNIKFRLPKEELYKRFFRAIPAHLWYSEEPYIDGSVRKRWFEKIVLRLHEEGFPIGDWASRVIEDVLQNRDANRGDDNAEMKAKENLELPEYEFKEDYKGYKIYQYTKRFYAVPVHVTELDFMIYNELPRGVLRDITIEALKSVIDTSQDWADSRGQYKVVSKPHKLLSDQEKSNYEYVIKLDENFYAFTNEQWIEVKKHLSLDEVDQVKVNSHYRDNWSGVLVTYAGEYKIIGCADQYYTVPLDVPRMTAEMLPEMSNYGISAFVTFNDAVDHAWSHSSSKIASALVRETSENSEEQNVGENLGPASEAFTSKPILLEEKGDYHIIGYEGVIYGVPSQYSDVDLTEVDIISWPGVIRDVSRDAVLDQVEEKQGMAMLYGQAQL